ncbi:hypothetical protein V8E54_009843 [Elaphomyces granulatus]
MPNTRLAECFRVKEGSTVKISFQPPNRQTAGNMECNGISIPNVFNLPFTHPISTKAPEIFDSFVTAPGQPLNLMDARVLIRIPQVGAQRQVDAINLLCGLNPLAPYANKWHKVFLNQSRGMRINQDPLAELDPNHENFQKEQVKTSSREIFSIMLLSFSWSVSSFANGSWVILTPRLWLRSTLCHFFACGASGLSPQRRLTVSTYRCAPTCGM